MKHNSHSSDNSIPGLLKTAVARRQFTHNGKLIEPGETIEADAETIQELAHARLIDAYSIAGGNFELELMSDNYHKVNVWSQHMGNLAGEPFYRVEFLTDVPGLLVKAGDKRRLRRSHALSFPYIFKSDLEYDQSNRIRSSNFVPAIIIHEGRPNRLPADVVAARMAAVAEAKAKEQRGDWMSPVMETPLIPQS
jgi:hypothetical protein